MKTKYIKLNEYSHYYLIIIIFVKKTEKWH